MNIRKFSVFGILYFFIICISGVSQSVNTATYKPWYTYDEICKICSDWAKNYPTMVKSDTFGLSQKNRPIIRVRINCAEDKTPRQRFFFDGATHGNEKIGAEICMRVMKELIEKYASDPKIKTVVDRSEFVFIPVINPDGFCSGTQGRRSLENGKDGDRAGGIKLAGKDSDGSLPYQWPELKAMYRMHVDAPTYFGLDYHCGQESFFFPFFANSLTGGILDLDACNSIKKFYPIPASHSGQLVDFTQEYGDRGGGVTNDGAYAKNGSLSCMPEVCPHYPAESLIDGITQKNLDHILAVIGEMQKGVCGVVRDAQTKAPLYARVKVKDKGAPVFSSPFSGAYYKYIPSPSGSLEVTVFSNGYKPQTKTVSAVSGAFATLDFDMEYDKNLKFYGLSVEMIGVANTMSLLEMYNCLEASDQKGTVVNNGFIVVDLGPYTYATHTSSEDITVYGVGTDAYTVNVSNDPSEIVDKGKTLGQGSGKASFDLSKAGIDKARFIRIDATGTATIDAIEALPHDLITPVSNAGSTTTVLPPPKISQNKTGRGIILQSHIPMGWFSVSIFDCRGKMVYRVAQSYAKTSALQFFTWTGIDMHGSRCSNGTYIFQINTTQSSAAVKASLY